MSQDKKAQDKKDALLVVGGLPDDHFAEVIAELTVHMWVRRVLREQVFKELKEKVKRIDK